MEKCGSPGQVGGVVKGGVVPLSLTLGRGWDSEIVHRRFMCAALAKRLLTVLILCV